MPVPAALQALTGCANPNTGTTNGDWGVGSDPVYTVVDNTAPVVGTPIYASNAVFWTSRETAPGQSILLTGAFTDAVKSVRLALIPPGTIDWQTLVSGSATVVSPTQQGTTGLSFIVPSSFAAGVYGFQIEDPSAAPVLGLANVPSLNWAIGVPSTTDPSQALQHQVYDCGVEPGGVLRLFGKNFIPSNQVILQASGGVAYSLAPSKLDSNSVAAPIPSTLAPGTYTRVDRSCPLERYLKPSRPDHGSCASIAQCPERHLLCPGGRWRYRQYQASSIVPGLVCSDCRLQGGRIYINSCRQLCAYGRGHSALVRGPGRILCHCN